jgi:DNA-binding transcriptional LysR family regulator
MRLTEGGQRLMPIASQMVSLGVQAEAAVRSASGAAEQLRLVVSTEIGEFVASGLVEAFGARGRAVEVSVGVASGLEMAALVGERLAHAALGPRLDGERGWGIESVPVISCQLVVVAAPGTRPGASTPWLIDASATDPSSSVFALLEWLRVPERLVHVFPSWSAAWSAAADGEGVAPAHQHLVAPQVERGRLRLVDVPGTPAPAPWFVSTVGIEGRVPAATSFRSFLTTPLAMQLLHRPGRGVPAARFRPPVYVTIWS